ncbi:F-box/kelch-repeat protein At3g06240 [Triticum aestivum]|uniref:F-box/kelch-repeat protein At3g06240 n=1 Tax=Triticum aestivum TaxID=4565 RepID=UPI00084590B9|nr:F-box/kelch-repeat protein At3g06240-like [Triticum aestivum]
MAKRRRCAELPDHLIEEIFLRLPAKSVLGCRCLSRAWAAKLSSENFKDRHHCMANLHGGPRIFGTQHWIYATEPKVLAPLTIIPRVIPLDSFPRLGTALPSSIEGEEEDDAPPGPIVAHLVTAQCRGLVIVTISPTRKTFLPDMSYVCNPSTGQMTALPEGRTTGYRGSSEYNENYYRLGLGYDVRTRKHKVVRIYYRRGGLMSAGCEVYVINGPMGSWRPIGEKPMGWIDLYSPSVFAQGHVYWVAYRHREMFIMSFFLATEKFGTIQPPLDMDNKHMYDLTELGGRLCLFTYQSGQHCNIWLLNQYGSAGASWELQYRINASPEVMLFGASPLAIIDNGRRILLTQPSFPYQIYAYNPVTHEIENLLDWSGSSISSPTLGISYVAVYEESLASPGRQPCKETILISSTSTQALCLLLQLQYLSQHTIGRLMCVCRSWRSMICSNQ